METSNRDIPALLDSAYRLTDLRGFMSRYGPPLMDIIPFSFRNRSGVQNASKKALIREFAKVFTSREHFNAFLSVLDEPVRQVLYHLVWEAGDHSAALLSQLYGADFLLPYDDKNTRLFRPTEHIDPKYMLFRYNEQFTYRLFDPERHLYAYLPDDLRDLFKAYLPPPPGYDLDFLDEIDSTEYMFRNEGRILSSLDLILAYIDQGHLKFSKSGEKVLVRSLKEMAEYCRVEEFYRTGDPAVRYMRASLLTEFILDSVMPEIADPVRRFKGLILKQLFGTSVRPSRYRLRDLLLHLNGFPQLESSYTAPFLQEKEERVRIHLFDLFSRLSTDHWVSMSNLYTYCLYRGKDFEIIDRHQATHFLYYSQEDTEDRSFYTSRRTPVTNSLYGPALLAPFVKGTMFLAAGFGLVDIAYDRPENDPAIRRKGKPYISVFDGLRYVRLSQLGAYVMGKSDAFTAAVELPTARLTLDDRRLLITMEGEDKLKILILEKIGEPISESAFRVTYASFLKGCNNEADIQQKMKLFNEQISDAPPAVWTDFLKKIQARINPLTRAGNVVLYKLKPDPELISLVATDPILKEHILKAEDYHIAVENKHFRTVMDRLASFGYFIDTV